MLNHRNPAICSRRPWTASFHPASTAKTENPENHRINLRVKAGTNHRRIADSRKFRFCSPLHIDELRERALYAASSIAGSALKIGRH
jgi:hypothetical protein